MPELSAIKSFIRSAAMQAAWILGTLAILFGVAQLSERTGAAKPEGVKLRVALFINGTLGDKSFFDSAARGLKNAKQTLPVMVKVIEGGTDPTRWEAALTDLADSGDFDLIVAGTFTMVPYIQRLAGEFPQARFVVFDAAVDYAACKCANVHSILFRQNEGAYLAGYLAASLDRAGFAGLKPSSGLGVVGGMQFPVIDDFIVGFRAGALAATPGVTVLSQYANSFSDPAAGKEIAKAQYGRGVALIFHAAGATGQGVNEAALEAGRYAIAVDMDQYAMYQATKPALASRIVTSVLKNVDVAVLRAIQQQLEGRLAFGRTESLGLAEHGVSLARNSMVLSQAPPALLKSLDEVETAIVEKRVMVPSAFTPKAVASAARGAP
ncbi:BMP family protein [Ramlibacter sp. WS9]|uniref:BMP family lipoprotein n=1 Tax=Ramlibacter sp. WS9 TaxID=1882741 RepID=UPI001E5E017B|nr:BMP family ABC transporter substrate-binding protein [Ramlibacter sp. WS9]